jgi:hypothetical protein
MKLVSTKVVDISKISGAVKMTCLWEMEDLYVVTVHTDLVDLSYCSFGWNNISSYVAVDCYLANENGAIISSIDLAKKESGDIEAIHRDYALKAFQLLKA